MKSLSRQIRRRRERELARRKRQIHKSEDDEGMQVIHRELLKFQEEYRDSVYTGAEDDYYWHVKTTLQLLERMHREVMVETQCNDCLEDFYQEKFYTFDDFGYEFNAYGIARRRGIREALAS